MRPFRFWAQTSKRYPSPLLANSAWRSVHQKPGCLSEPRLAPSAPYSCCRIASRWDDWLPPPQTCAEQLERRWRNEQLPMAVVAANFQHCPAVVEIGQRYFIARRRASLALALWACGPLFSFHQLRQTSDQFGEAPRLSSTQLWVIDPSRGPVKDKGQWQTTAVLDEKAIPSGFDSYAGADTRAQSESGPFDLWVKTWNARDFLFFKQPTFFPKACDCLP